MPKQKVYISSTFRDLKEYRALLRDFFYKEIKQQFELCKIMEHMWDDGSQTPFVEECVREVKAADIYILILGNKVGSFPPNETRTYTEIELDTAIEGNKKIYVFRFEAFDTAQMDHPTKHAELLAKFAGKPTHTFANDDQLEKHLLKRLMPHTGVPVQHKMAETFYGMLNELPDNYFGRTDELDTIHTYLNPKDHTLPPETAIVGEGGMGKTALMTKYFWEHRYQYKYFIFLFCESGIVPEFEKMALLRLPKYHELQESDRITEMVNYLNNMVLEAKGIMLFDNVNNEAHWKDFKKKYGLIAWDKLITTRVKHLTTKEIDLLPLPEPLALDLFYSFYTHEDRTSTEPTVKQLLAGMFYNTLLIEIFAKVLDQQFGLFEESIVSFIGKFKEKGLFESVESGYQVQTQYTKNIHKYEAEQVNDILQVMYDVAGLNSQQKEILQTLALLPTSKHKIATVIELLKPADKVGFYNQLKALSAWITIDNHQLSMKDLVQEMLLHSCGGVFNALQEDLLKTLSDRMDEDQTEIAKIIQVYHPIANGVLKNAARVKANLTDAMYDLFEDIQYFEKNVLKSGSDANAIYQNYKIFIETQEAGNGHSLIFSNLYEEFVEICLRSEQFEEAIHYQKLLVGYQKAQPTNLKTYATQLKKLISIYQLKF
jgi:hypothetical protein